MNPLQVRIGLEIHIQLATDSKMFSSDRVVYGDYPNTHLSPTTLALPGTLPTVNQKAFDYAIKLGLACQSSITRLNYFDRKSYFYPDLPKGFQITQDKTPICRGGFISIHLPSGQRKEISIMRMHLEEDTGKSIYDDGDQVTLLDFNRAGTPLVELVTEPVISTGQEAYQFLYQVRKLVRYLEICDGNMEEASLRCDVNISLQEKGSTVLGTRVEVKNINSMHNVQKAIDYEIERQTKLLESGVAVMAETRQFKQELGATVSLRAKESANDYRYFGEPDIPAVYVSQNWIDSISAAMPPLPDALLEKFMHQYGLAYGVAKQLSEDKDMALFFDAICQATSIYTMAANWLLGPVKGYLNQMSMKFKDFKLKPKDIVDLINLVQDGSVGFSAAAMHIFPLFVENPNKSPKAWAKALNLCCDTDQNKLRALIDQVVDMYPDKVQAYKKGKTGILAMLMGEVMKQSQGRADARLASQWLKELLDR